MPPSYILRLFLCILRNSFLVLCHTFYFIVLYLILIVSVSIQNLASLLTTTRALSPKLKLSRFKKIVALKYYILKPFFFANKNEILIIIFRCPGTNLLIKNTIKLINVIFLSATDLREKYATCLQK